MLTESECWAIVEEIDWGNKYDTIDCGMVATMLAVRLGKEKADALKHFVRKKEHEINRAITKWEKDEGKSVGLGDDGFGDLCSHIVGMGKNLFEAHIANPSLAQERARKFMFGEKFSYCIPDRNTAAELDAEELTQFRDRIVNKFQSIIDTVPALASLATDVIREVNAAETSERTEEEYNNLWDSIRKEAQRIENTTVGTKSQIEELSAAAQFVGGWGPRNYVSGVRKIRKARELMGKVA